LQNYKYSTQFCTTGNWGMPASSGRGPGTPADDPSEEGGAEEAAAFIAEHVAELARLARRHELAMLSHLLEMAQMEAAEHVRLRGKKNLS
jgi:hypothetical protein